MSSNQKREVLSTEADKLIKEMSFKMFEFIKIMKKEKPNINILKFCLGVNCSDAIDEMYKKIDTFMIYIKNTDSVDADEFIVSKGKTISNKVEIKDFTILCINS